jgi:hypothetical protein
VAWVALLLGDEVRVHWWRLSTVEISDRLRKLNVEIADRETTGDKAWFEPVLHPEFRMRRASGVTVTRDEFIGAVDRSAERRTEDVMGTELDLTAAVICVVSMKDDDGTWKSFRNYRVFVRADTAADWQLLGGRTNALVPRPTSSG